MKFAKNVRKFSSATFSKIKKTKLSGLKWVPTGEDEHAKAEADLLSFSKVNYTQSIVKLKNNVSINTVKFGCGKENLLLIHGMFSRKILAPFFLTFPSKKKRIWKRTWDFHRQLGVPL